MSTRPQRALETPVDTIARLQTELNELRSKIQGERHRRRWLYLHDVFNDGTRRGAFYYAGDSLLIRREIINPEPGFPGTVQGGELLFIPGLAALRYVDETSGQLLGEVFFNAEGEAKLLARDMLNPLFEKGVLHLQQTGDTTMFASLHARILADWDIHLDNTGGNNNGNIWINSDNDLNLDAERNIWLRAPTDINVESDGAVFIRGNADNSGDRAEIALYGNGETELFINGDSHGGLVGFSDIKPFIIDHPDDPYRWLVHGCTESDRAGVEYWGEAEIIDGEAIVELPSYFESLTTEENRSVLVTPIDELCMVAASRIEYGQFTIKCSGPDGTKVSWLVKAERKGAAGFPVEPLKSETEVRGNGPYRYFVKR